MKAAALLSLAIGVSLAGSAPALAQYSPITSIPTQSFGDTSHLVGTVVERDPSQMVAVDNLHAQAGLDRYADCLVAKGRLRGKLAAYVRVIPNSPAMNELSKAAIDRSCANEAVESSTGVRLNIRLDTLRQALFGSMYRREFAATAVALPPDLPPLSLASEFDGPTEALTPEFRGYRALGDCVVRARPDAARAWVMTPFDSPGAKTAQAAVVPALPECLAAGQTIAVAPYSLRGIVAEALYRLTQAAPTNPTSEPAK